MPRYLFYIVDGCPNNEAISIDLANDQAAQVEAIRLTAQIVKDKAAQISSTDDLSVSVTDEANLGLFTVVLSVMTSPAVRR